MQTIENIMATVDASIMQQHLEYLACDPLPCRQLNVTLPGHAENTLYEANAYIDSLLTSWGYAVDKVGVKQQAFRRDKTKPLAHQYSTPAPEDPWYTAYNVFGRKTGALFPDEVIVVLGHKDSQSWVECSPGANDNAIGTVGVLEVARVLADYAAQRSIWFMFCNEEHTPWTSIAAAQDLAASGLDVVGVLNLDSLGAKCAADRAAGMMTNVTRYSTPEGKALADLMCEINERYAIGLRQSTFFCPVPGDDDGSFVKAGIPQAILNIGSLPYTEENYHTLGDTVDAVDVRNAALTVQLSAAFVIHLDQFGRPY